MKKYNEPNVVMLITKKGKEDRAQQRKEMGSPDPIYIIDGKQASKEQLKELDSNVIESITVLKDEKSLKKYNTKVGVILVTTKKNK
jgi:hypothetical protein